MVENNNNKVKVLVAFIGAEPARDTDYAAFVEKDNVQGVYQLKNGEKGIERYGYPFLAKIKEEVFDEIIFIGTTGSKWEELQQHLYKKNNTNIEHNNSQDHQEWIKQNLNNEENIRKFEDDVARNICNIINGKGIKVKLLLITEGRTDNENRRNIEIIKNELYQMNISAITLDVTNGLRSHPMYVMSIINNISSIYDSPIPINIYYGMFCAKVETNNQGEYVVAEGRDGVAPMVDLKEITQLNEWTYAVNEFTSNGSVIRIINLLDKIEEQYYKECSDALKAFSFAVNSNNLKILEDAIGKIRCIQRKMVKKNKLDYADMCLKRVVSKIWEKFSWGEAGESLKYSSYMFSLAEWYFEQNRLGDSVRTFQEAVITYVMEAYPLQISALLDRRMFKWNTNNIINDFLFDAAVRKIIRDALFEDEQIIEGRENEYNSWKNWIEEYQYMKKYIHNPEELLYGAADIEKIGINVNKAKEIVEKFSAKMKIERIPEESDAEVESVNPKFLPQRIEYLLAINYNDVFISYRRSYHSVDSKRLNDGVLLVTAISDYLESKGLRVFVDKNRLDGTEGEFTRHLHQNLINSKLCLVVLGKNAYSKDYVDSDAYYKEIVMAVQNDMKIAVVCMNDFYLNGKTLYGKDVESCNELMKVSEDFQRIGSQYSDTWSYENILSMRECIYSEIKKMIE